MPLWTEIIDPVEATAAARVELAEYERQNSLAKYLPTIGVDGDTVEVFSTDDGLVSEANFRAWNAPPEIGDSQAISSTIVKLPAISRNEPIDEKTPADFGVDEKQLRELHIRLRNPAGAGAPQA